MPEFKSPIGSKQITGTPMRDFSVPDDSGFVSQPPVQMPQRQQQAPVTFDTNAMRDFQAAMMQAEHPPVQMKELSDIERQVIESRKARRDGKERMSDGARRRIEMLIGMTQLTKTIEVGGASFVLKTLQARDARTALTAAAEYDGTVQFSFEYSKQLLARSLIQISGVDIDQFLSSSDLETRLDFVDMLPQSLFTRLYNEYVVLDNESRDKFVMKNELQVQEVVEDLKK